MSDTAVVADTTINPAQAGPAVPNQDRAPVETPADNAAATATETTTETTTEAPATTPQVGDEPADEGKLEGPTSEDADENGVITYPETGDVGMDLALEFVGKLGIGMDHPAMQATLNNDFGPIEAVLHQMGDKATGYEKFLTLAKEANTKALNAAKEKATNIGNAVASVLGDAQAQVLAWASKTATPEEKASINTMLAADPVQARAAANILLNAFEKASGVVINPASATTADTGSTPAQSIKPLTNKEFARECDTLNRKHGGNFINTPEYRALVARLG